MPELCVLTGQSPEMRNNFQLQKDLNKIIKPYPGTRMKKSKELIELMHKNEITSKVLHKWNISISSKPIEITCKKINAGDIVMGDNNKFSLENTPDLDRKIQTRMFDQPNLARIGIFCASRDKETCISFFKTLENCIETFSYPMDKPR